MADTAIQDRMITNMCFGCGAGNDKGLRIKSHWDGEKATCTFHPEPHMTAGPPQYLNGGIIATLIDCHSICAAVADTYEREGRAQGSDPEVWFVTGEMTVRYQRPTPIDKPVELSARVTERGEKKSVVECTLASAGHVCATGRLVGIRVSDDWLNG